MPTALWSLLYSTTVLYDYCVKLQAEYAFFAVKKKTDKMKPRIGVLNFSTKRSDINIKTAKLLKRVQP